MSRHERILCPFHEERTPSCVLYHDHYRCYSCGAYGPLSKIGLEGKPYVKPEKEDLKRTLEYIASLGLSPIRGLSLPVDSGGYYIVWPGNDYYKKRNAFSEPKYLCPKGHSKPIFVPYKAANRRLAIVEGEINALSLSTIKPNYTVCSPGGVGSFTGKDYEKYCNFYLQYNSYIVIVDKDGVGVDAAINLQRKLLQHSHDVTIVALEEDCNELLCHGRLEERMGMYSRLRPEQRQAVQTPREAN